MNETYNIYCDESCHLERDGQQAMVLGALWCPTRRAHELSIQIRELKYRHFVGAHAEVKWTKVSPAKQALYLELVDSFFAEPDLHFRGVIIPQKTVLRHDAFGQTHDEWYYKMFFVLLSPILQPQDRYRIYLDIKDTHGAAKAAHLREVLANSKYDFSRQIIERVQIVRSHEVGLFQLADLLTGAIGYVNRGLSASAAKSAIVARLRQRSGYSLVRNTLLRESKLNVLRWEAEQS